MAKGCNTFVFQSPKPRVSIIPPRSKPGFVFTPGSPGPAGRDLQIDGTADSYASLLGVTPVRVGELWQTLDTGALYTWTTEGWPAEDQGRLLQGPQGETGRGISALSIDGDDLVASMTRGPTERVQVPSIAASADSAAAAASSAALADGHRQSAQAARTGAETAQGEAEAHAVAAGESANAADGSAVAAANSVTEAGAHVVAASGHADRAEGAEAGAEQFAIEAGGHANTAANHANTATGAAGQVSLDRQAVTQDRNEVEGLAAGVQQIVNDGAAAVRAEVTDDAAAAQNARQASEAARDLSQGYSGTAQNASSAAVEAQNGAESARDVAIGAADNAAASETAAAGFADTASAARDGAVSARDGAESARTGAETARDGAVSARDEAESVRDELETDVTAAAYAASAEKIAELVGDAPGELDTIHKLAEYVQVHGTAIGALNSALNNRVVGAYRIVVQDEAPGEDAPLNQITFVRGDT